MFKKKFYFVVLSTLLLTLLLGLCGTCYAVELGQVKNLIYNGMTNYFNISDEDARLKITNYPYWTNVENYCNSAYYLIAGDFGGNTSITIWFVPTTQTTSFRNYTSNGQVVTDVYSKKYAQMIFGSGAFNANITTWANGSNISGQRIRNCIYVGNDVYSYNSTDKLYYDEYYNPSWFDLTGDYYNTIIWEYIPNDQGTVTITQTGMSGGAGNYHLTSGVLKDNLGIIRDAEYIKNIHITVRGYNKIQNAYTNTLRYIDYYDKDRDGFIWDKYPGTTSNNNGVYSHTIMLDTNQYFDCVLQFDITSYDTSLSEFVFWYYVLSDHTKIVNGSIIAIDTFSGDYISDYNNQTNDVVQQNQTDDIVNTLTDDSDVDNLIGGFLNSGDLLNEIGGYNTFENPFIAFVQDLMENFVDIFTGDDNPYISFTWQGETYTFYASQFRLPNGSMRDFITAICNAFFVWGLIKYGYQLYEWIRTGRIQNWLNNTSSGNIEDYFLF